MNQPFIFQGVTIIHQPEFSICENSTISSESLKKTSHVTELPFPKIFPNFVQEAQVKTLGFTSRCLGIPWKTWGGFFGRKFSPLRGLILDPYQLLVGSELYLDSERFSLTRKVTAFFKEKVRCKKQKLIVEVFIYRK